ncbi:MAG TPA: aldo/keto reductase [Flavisolibacter sp.]|nr:aldo/keto reductase [Flavisolibacter sp.]
MEYRKFGTTGMQVSEVGFGSWAIGGNATIGNTAIGWGPADDTTSKQAIRAALDAGINFFDTADIYGLGHSEQLLGATLKGSNVIIATKVGNVSRDNQFTVDYSKEHILSACEQSLKRFNRDVIDYYQLHTARKQHLENGECIEAMQLLQQQGKIRYWGISLNTFDPYPEADFFMNNNLGSGFQLVLNLINQRGLSLIKNAASRGYGIIARMPLQFGLLTGKFSADSHFEITDHRHNRLTPGIITISNDALQTIWELCDKYQVSKTQLAMSYILSYSGVSTVIPGIRTPEHVLLNTTGLVKLAEADMNMIENEGHAALASLLSLIEKQG